MKISKNINITILDYGVGNVTSIKNCLEHLEYQNISISNEISKLKKCERIILPGVGAFHEASVKLLQSKLGQQINELVIEKNIPVLGICLGMQIMATRGYENGSENGLNWIQGSVIRIPSSGNIKIPHVGWNNISLSKHNTSNLLDGMDENSTFYFDHSYYFEVKENTDIIAYTNYSKLLPVAVNKKNIYGVQFHPEKSQRNGLILFRNFIEKT